MQQSTYSESLFNIDTIDRAALMVCRQHARSCSQNIIYKLNCNYKYLTINIVYVYIEFISH